MPITPKRGPFCMPKLKLTALSTANTSPIAKAEVRAELVELRGWIAQQAKTADGEWKVFYAAQMEAASGARGGAGAGGFCCWWDGRQRSQRPRTDDDTCRTSDLVP